MELLVFQKFVQIPENGFFKEFWWGDGFDVETIIQHVVYVLGAWCWRAID